jgi:hypothetical protein
LSPAFLVAPRTRTVPDSGPLARTTNASITPASGVGSSAPAARRTRR